MHEKEHITLSELVKQARDFIEQNPTLIRENRNDRKPHSLDLVRGLSLAAEWLEDQGKAGEKMLLKSAYPQLIAATYDALAPQPEQRIGQTHEALVEKLEEVITRFHLRSAIPQEGKDNIFHHEYKEPEGPKRAPDDPGYHWEEEFDPNPMTDQMGRTYTNRKLIPHPPPWADIVITPNFDGLTNILKTADEYIRHNPAHITNRRAVRQGLMIAIEGLEEEMDPTVLFEKPVHAQLLIGLYDALKVQKDNWYGSQTLATVDGGVLSSFNSGPGVEFRDRLMKEIKQMVDDFAREPERPDLMDLSQQNTGHHRENIFHHHSETRFLKPYIGK